MDITMLMAVLSPCLPFLVKLGDKTIESAGSKIGPDTWEMAKKIWAKLHPKLAAKEDAKIAMEQLAAKPESEARKAVFQEELEAIFQEHPDLAATITQLLQESAPTTATVQINQSIDHNEGQVIGQMRGGKAIGRVDGNIQGDVNL